jgi:hypothetical protein
MTTITTRSGKGSPLTNDEVDANFTNLNTDKAELSGASFTGNVTFADNRKAIFGAGSDLQIYHDGANSYIQNATNSLIIQNDSDDKQVIIKSDNGSGGVADYFRANGTTGEALLYHYGSSKLTTTSTGIDVTGVITTDGMTTSADINFGDNDKAVFGAGSDLQIYHDGSNSFVSEVGTGALVLQSNGSYTLIQNSSGVANARFDSAGAASLRYNGAEKLATTSTGIDVTGDITLGDTNPTITFNDSSVTNLSHTISSASDNLRIMADVNGVDAGSRVEIFDGTTEVARFEAGAVDVTGTVTADGLTVDGATLLDNGTNATHLTLTGTTNRGLTISTTNTGGQNDSGAIYDAQDTAGGGVGSHEFRVGGESKLLIAADGDISFYEDTGTTAKFFWDASAESLGIGTTDPWETLSIPFNEKLSFGSSTYPFSISRSSSGELITTFEDGYSSSSARIDFKMANGTKTPLSLLGSGNVGIGTSSPSQALAVETSSAGVTRINVTNTGNAAAGAGVQMVTKNGATQVSNATLRTDNAGNFSIFTGTTGEAERMRIDSSGHLLLGTSGSFGTLGTLVVQQTADSKGIAIVDSAEANTFFIENQGDEVKFRLNATSPFTFTHNTTERMRIDASGNLLVGRSSAGAAATDNGHVFYGTGQHYIFSNATECVRFYETSGSGQQVGSISITSSATTFNTSSDQRLKDNIVDAPSASDDIDAIQVRSFDWKADGSHQKYGMVAQELQSIAPEAVTGDADSDDMMGVDYSKLVPMMLKEIQSLRARVAQLEGEN